MKKVYIDMFLLTNTRCNNYKKYNIYICICWCSFDLHVLALIIKVHRPTGKVAILYNQYNALFTNQCQEQLMNSDYSMV